MQLDLLPPDLAGQVKSLQDYDFTSAEAQRRFDELMDRLRQQLMQQYVNQMAGSMQSQSPEDMQRLKDMLAELNQMLDQRERGEEPGHFEDFMERYGDFFPENPQTLDELLEVMAQRMAAMQAMLNSMTPEQRAQLQGLAEQLLEDMDLRWQVDQLAPDLPRRSPSWAGTAATTSAARTRSAFAEAAELMDELGDLDQLENLLRGGHQPGRAGRGRHRPGPRAARRRRGRQPRAAGGAGRRCSRRPGSSSTARAASS